MRPVSVQTVIHSLVSLSLLGQSTYWNFRVLHERVMDVKYHIYSEHSVSTINE